MVIKNIYDDLFHVLRENNGKIEAKSVRDIMDAYQIASRQGFFISSLKAIVDYLKELPINILQQNCTTKISNFSELSSYLEKMDNIFDLSEYQDEMGFEFLKNEKIVRLEKIDEKLFGEFIDITVSSSSYNAYLKKEIDLVNNTPEYFFDNDSYKYENRPKLIKEDKSNLAKSVLFDLMAADQYLISWDSINDKEILWHWLGVFVGNNNIPNIRRHLTDELYHNSNYVFRIDKSSALFESSNFLIYGVFFGEEKYIGTIRKSDMPKLSLISEKLGIQLRELK